MPAPTLLTLQQLLSTSFLPVLTLGKQLTRHHLHLPVSMQQKLMIMKKVSLLIANTTAATNATSSCAADTQINIMAGEDLVTILTVLLDTTIIIARITRDVMSVIRKTVGHGTTQRMSGKQPERHSENAVNATDASISVSPTSIMRSCNISNSVKATKRKTKHYNR